jgi:hypothetical protein
MGINSPRNREHLLDPGRPWVGLMGENLRSFHTSLHSPLKEREGVAYSSCVCLMGLSLRSIQSHANS